MIWRSPPRPDLGWGRPIAAVLIGIGFPAIPGAAYLWFAAVDFESAQTAAGTLLWITWLLAACLTAAPLFGWLAAPVLVPAVRYAARRGWAGPFSLILCGLLLGLPLAHFILNGDLTTESPQMIPFMVSAICIQSLCGWIILRRGPGEAQERNAA